MMNFDASSGVERSPARSTQDTSDASPGSAPPADAFMSLGLVGDCAAMRRLRTDVLRTARSDATVLVTGESGSGKELVARALHLHSRRSRAPFVAVNVATLRRDLLASELFGHERGAFTGAVTSHKGLFEQAHGGTLLLDEIGELDPAAQADLLRVLETGDVRPVGSERSRKIDVRVIAATHRDLGAMVVAGHFRADLYYRLDVLRVAVPALRQRRGDFPVLVNHLLERLTGDPAPRGRQLSADARGALARHLWPGNVRELVNVLRRALARSDARLITGAMIREAIGKPLRCVAPKDTPLALTESVIINALRGAGGNISAAARRLGVPRSTLRDRLPRTVTP